jgi:hypothetical protein
MDLVLIERLAGLGLTKKHIATLAGLTTREADQLESLYPEIANTIEQGRAGRMTMLAEQLMKLAMGDQPDLKAIQSAMIMVGGEAYRTDKPTTSITNNTLIALPSPTEALEILRNDPALLDGEIIDEVNKK